MFDKNDAVGKSTEMSAKLFAIMADEVIKACGEAEGSKIVTKAVRRYGVMRANAIKKKILNDGKEVTFETIEHYSDYPPNNAWDCDTQINQNSLKEVTHICPFSTAFREIGLEKVGSLYCNEIDIALNETFFGDIIFERPRLFCDSPDAPCEMIITLNKKEER